MVLSCTILGMNGKDIKRLSFDISENKHNNHSIYGLQSKKFAGYIPARE